MRAGRAWWPDMTSSRTHLVARWPRMPAESWAPLRAIFARSAAGRCSLVGARSPLALPIDVPLVGASQRHCAALVAAKRAALCRAQHGGGGRRRAAAVRRCSGDVVMADFF
ncbi:hypothetical protein F511_46746 [Dorcoceras hygrometricum]|uniref:Uncharacterized protein n=1 Tax=Dorcoceras hygrometricum TaxID=472368 RepID=A0A2Z6ZTA4_9LAMI|nr:hypothetical protein F511_46746 [Dorcoceras hygrometricum]